MLMRDEREGGANMAIKDMRYMWSEIDSPLEKSSQSSLQGAHTMEDMCERVPTA